MGSPKVLLWDYYFKLCLSFLNYILCFQHQVSFNLVLS